MLPPKVLTEADLVFHPHKVGLIRESKRLKYEQAIRQEIVRHPQV